MDTGNWAGVIILFVLGMLTLGLTIQGMITQPMVAGVDAKVAEAVAKLDIATANAAGIGDKIAADMKANLSAELGRVIAGYVEKQIANITATTAEELYTTKLQKLYTPLEEACKLLNDAQNTSGFKLDYNELGGYCESPLVLPSVISDCNDRVESLDRANAHCNDDLNNCYHRY